ncbi:bifunctional UDP-N-acetylglucosamine diphosphorylase/glucosamine-1-phosphate N-acetyltransferase GlmU [Methylicorpusculum sp.]|uniref:bifunctional UDP-N-acetylglucosamine diphosphorylase/glucosamine-1-phosphate N-acetyltransferase GlmU n=2 Tax=Methylicorpusculum sp. TaxID=2713644 RepID=UPI002731CA21|nr:bifunctional UDP-N-acetylglucosamine diphosphorylase/glucosamine-1-phosphate N-acetyltransferase GlmU [Methylicorpusculum sp.]MDP2177337.1 bifunctional UDP-N-acetylglucosamine diphosphorylase/glucosamine-1-phosphate N-acetyltransferase GlmU [Methylicorpusculum sp.]MDP3531016.1 bifunctional UDP-N-acetylglucosamine diphosphorylase/glucosamine-1-phosphate N-acetyltransferase GlmU [Methylicorpusculum sp.]
MKLTTVILAAGKGTRMRSAMPKILHKIANRSLLEHVYDMSRELDNNEIKIIYGHGGNQVLETLKHLEAEWTEQKEQLGTGHAVQQVQSQIADDAIVLILYGDVPLLKLNTVQKLLEGAKESLSLLTVTLANPSGYGRIVRNEQNKVVKIVEEKDADVSQKMINEVNTGILAVRGGLLKTWLSRLENNNAQKEYYLTDVIEMAVNDGFEIVTSQPASEDEVLGVNNRMQLAHLERVYQKEQAEKMMAEGVTLADPARFEVRGYVDKLGIDIEIDINVILEGAISIGNNVKIGANSIIKNAVIHDDVEILPNCIIEDAEVGRGSRVGPFARLRPQALLADNVHIGNFVEIKKSKIATGSKVNHLSYIGDSVIGSHVNIGAGTITCNYDGVNKFQTIIGDNAFIGSNSQLVAPVSIGNNATIGAGSTITKDTPDGQLTLARAKQISIASWQRPVKKEK